MTQTHQNKPSSVAVIGGGLVGLTTAAFLTEQDIHVTIVDSSAAGSGASKGNAGFLCEALPEPVAAPGAYKTALKSLTDPTSALRVSPRAVPELLPWMTHFVRACTKSRYEGARKALATLNVESPPARARLKAMGINLDHGPDLMVGYHDEAEAQKFYEHLQPMKQWGAKVPTEFLDGTGLRLIAPALTDHVRAGFLLPGDHAIDPRAYVESAIELLKSRGVTFEQHQRVTQFETTNDRVRTVVTDRKKIAADAVLLSGGAGIDSVAKLLNLKFQVVGGQGYNVAVSPNAGLKNPIIYEEVHAVTTPFADRIRLGGTMEFGGANPRFDQRRVDAIIKSLRQFVNLDFDAAFDTWAGSRPMSADGLPLIGRPRSWSNVFVGAGHGMFGMTFAPVSGSILSELISTGTTNSDLSAFDVDRFKR